MKLRDWLKASNVSIKSFSEELGVERAMVYRYFTGAMPRARTIRRIELLTGGAVTAQDFYDSAMGRNNSNWQQEKKLERPAAQSSTSTDTTRPPVRGPSRSFAWPDLSDQNITLAPSWRIAGRLSPTPAGNTHRPTPAVLCSAITNYILDGKGSSQHPCTGQAKQTGQAPSTSERGSASNSTQGGVATYRRLSLLRPTG